MSELCQSDLDEVIAVINELIVDDPNIDDFDLNLEIWGALEQAGMGKHEIGAYIKEHAADLVGIARVKGLLGVI